MRRSLPRLVVRLIEAVTPDPIARAGLLGDLEERYGDPATGGPIRRRWWLLRETLGTLLHYGRERTRGEGRSVNANRAAGIGGGAGGTSGLPTWSPGLFDGFRQDLAFAFRGLVRRPGFALLVTLTLALGIGANTAVFSAVNGLLLRPLPFEDPTELVLINQRSDEGFVASVSFPNYRDWKERTGAFSAMAAILPSSITISRDVGARVLEVGWIHGGFFEALGAEALIGRTISEAESEPGSPPLAVLSHGVWTSEFAGDPQAVGRDVVLGGQPVTIVGVMPAEFALYADTDVYLPVGWRTEAFPWNDRGTGAGTEVIGRLAAGVTVDQAQSALTRVTDELRAEYGPDANAAHVTPLNEWYVGDVSRQVLLLMVAVGFVLLVACANVANLLVVRGENRRGEIAVRSALGAGRGRVVRQLVTESLVCAAIAGGVGIVVARLGLDVLLATVASTLPANLAGRITVDPVVLGFAAAVSVVAALVAGLAPAWTTARTGLGATLRTSSAAARGGNRLRRTMVGSQVALSLMLLIGAGLLIQSMANLRVVDKGFDGSDVLTVRLFLPDEREPDRETWADFHRQVRDAVAAIPGVQNTSTSNHFPLAGNSWEMLYRDEQTPPDDRGQSVLLTMVSPEYFETYSIQLIEGRLFTEADRWGDQLVAVVDETLAEARWPGESAIGKQVSFEQARDPDGEMVQVWRTVVGVVDHVRHYELASTARIEAYTPIAQSVAWGFTSYLSVRSTTDPTALVGQIRRVVADLDPAVPLYRIRTMEAVLDRELGANRALRTMFILFGALTLLMGAVGIYSVVSHAAALRRPEMGLRIALGGPPKRMIAHMLGDSMVPVVAGLVLGAAGAVALTGLLGAWLFEVDGLELPVLVAATGTLGLVSAVSAWIPARRAASVPPAETLRSD